MLANSLLFASKMEIMFKLLTIWKGTINMLSINMTRSALTDSLYSHEIKYFGEYLIYDSKEKYKNIMLIISYTPHISSSDSVI